MIKEALLSLSGVEIFPIISLILFIFVFSMVVTWALRLDKNVVSEMENIPFGNEVNDGDKKNV